MTYKHRVGDKVRVTGEYPFQYPEYADTPRVGVVTRVKNGMVWKYDVELGGIVFAIGAGELVPYSDAVPSGLLALLNGARVPLGHGSELEMLVGYVKGDIILTLKLFAEPNDTTEQWVLTRKV